MAIRNGSGNVAIYAFVIHISWVTETYRAEQLFQRARPAFAVAARNRALQPQCSLFLRRTRGRLLSGYAA
jgi:hypothetical protein